MGKTKQITNTKNEITSTLASLLEKKSYDDITIGEISKVSQISRTTIYRHYENKNEIATQLINNIFSFSKHSENSSFEEILKHRLHSLKNSNLNAYLKSSVELRKVFFNAKDHSLMKAFDNLDQTTIQFISGGIGYSIRNWAISGFKQDTDELADQIIDLVNKTVSIK